MSEKGFRRNNFFSGRILTAADLDLEQTYFREKQRLHNRELHGFGIVSGLEVSRRRDKLIITAGLALDCEGNEIVVAETQSHPLPQLNLDTSVFLIIYYRQTKTNPTPVPSADNSSEPALIQESFSLAFENSSPDQSHRHKGGRRQSCGKPHGLVLARLRKTSGQWQLDRRLRRADVK
ncbi:MAG: hypothetical protein ACR2H6_08965 [Pyrinomonadaceae bacterium]